MAESDLFCIAECTSCSEEVRTLQCSATGSVLSGEFGKTGYYYYCLAENKIY